MRIVPRHVFLAVKLDGEMNTLFRKCTFASAGVVPNIHRFLLPPGSQDDDETATGFATTTPQPSLFGQPATTFGVQTSPSIFGTSGGQTFNMNELQSALPSEVQSQLAALKYVGQSFRHEKTKKKKAGFMGGVLNTQVTSIKFDDENSNDS